MSETEQIIEEANKLKCDLQSRFTGKSIDFGDAVIRVAHALLLAEAASERDLDMSDFSTRMLGKLSRRTV